MGRPNLDTTTLDFSFSSVAYKLTPREVGHPL
jgi:hypothetical protein